MFVKSFETQMQFVLQQCNLFCNNLIEGVGETPHTSLFFTDYIAGMTTQAYLALQCVSHIRPTILVKNTKYIVLHPPNMST